MSWKHVGMIVALGGILTGVWGLPAEERVSDQELLNQGKILIFDRQWEGARAIFQRLIQERPKSIVVPQAYYFIARCYQFQGKKAEALRAYETFLNNYPTEPFLPVEARKSIVELAASILEKGDASFRDHLLSALSDSRKEVRYFAAIRCSNLNDRTITSKAIPVLREITKGESERELVDRAKIALLRLEPNALSKSPAPRTGEKVEKSERRSDARMFHLEVYRNGASKPAVDLYLPLSLAQLAIAALDEPTKQELKKKGIDINNVWQDLVKHGPTNILTLRNGSDMVRIWIE